MNKITAACGNDCSACPRHMPKSPGELRLTAQLWHKVGYRDHVVSSEEIQCFGCTPANWCRYRIVGCAKSRGISTCGHCADYPCDKIESAFAQTLAFQQSCELLCSPAEYEQMSRAFFQKEQTLNAIAQSLK